MGIGIFKSCYTNLEAPAPNPSPSKFEILQIRRFDKGYILYVEYFGCRNCEGHKIMGYEGDYVSQVQLDPHFSETGISPIARFKPTARGWSLAEKFVKSL